MVRVVLVDDYVGFRESFALMLDLEPEITVTGQAGSVETARPLLAGADVAIIDLELGNESGLEILSELRSVNPRASAVVLTESTDPSEGARALGLGAAIVLHKSVTVDVILEAVRRLVRGERPGSPADRANVADLRDQRGERKRPETARGRFAPLERFTPRERDILHLLSQGCDDGEIARCLSVTTSTVRSHMRSIHGKLEAHSHVHALVVAVRQGVVTIG